VGACGFRPTDAGLIHLHSQPVTDLFETG